MARPRTNIISTYTLPSGWIGGFFRMLYSKGAIEIPGLGTFTIVEIKERKTFHNFSGSEIVLPAYRRLKFTQSPALKKHLSI